MIGTTPASRAVLLAAAVALAPTLAQASRSAVVIGNVGYDVAPLANSGRDAALVADRLEAIGFNVLRLYDLEYAEFATLADALARHFDAAEIGVVYYAGHAVQLEGTSYLLPVDLDARDVAAIEAKKVPLQALVAAVTAGAGDALRLIVIDACRNDPFSALSERIGVGLDTTAALAAAEGSEADTLIAYAASSGQLASDGPPGGNGPYAIALDRVLGQPGLELSTVTQRVASQVASATDEAQVPWVSGSVRNSYWLNRGEMRMLLDGLSSEPASLDRVMWYFIADTVTQLELRRFRLQFPESPYRDEAGERLAQFEAEPRPPQPPPAPAGAGETPPLVAEPDAPIPADLFRVDRDALSSLPGGLGSQATECDWLAADHLDPGRVVPGLRPSQINLGRAAQACVYAMLAFPDTPRFAHQLGRVLQTAGLHDWSRYYYAQAAGAGYGAALVNLGYLYREGIGVERNDATAHRYYLAAAAQGNLRARTNVGEDFLRGFGVPAADAGEAVQWFRLASESGWVAAQNALATRYLNGEGVPADPATAVTLYRLAALNGQREAMHNLARLLIAGKGVAADRAAGHRWLERAIAAGDRWSPLTLARDLVAGGEGAADPDRVLGLLKLAWSRGNPRAQLDLAWIHERGKIVPRDPAAAYAAARRAELDEVPKAAETADRLREELGPERVAAIDRTVDDERALNGR